MNYPNTALGSPAVIAEAMRYLGLKEIKGPLNEKTIMQWAKDIGVEKTYTSDEVAWCGLFVAKVVQKAKFNIVKKPLWARDWLNFGTKQSVAMLGDILVFERPGGGGHVAFYIAEDDKTYHILGGNQSDSVSITRIEKSRILGIRRCPWKTAQPNAVKKYFVAANGKISVNEA